MGSCKHPVCIYQGASAEEGGPKDEIERICQVWGRRIQANLPGDFTKSRSRSRHDLGPIPIRCATFPADWNITEKKYYSDLILGNILRVLSYLHQWAELGCRPQVGKLDKMKRTKLVRRTSSGWLMDTFLLVCHFKYEIFWGTRVFLKICIIFRSF